MNNYETTLGLDIGTTGIGWSIGNKHGVLYIPKNTKGTNKETLTGIRGKARSSRKRMQRHSKQIERLNRELRDISGTNYDAKSIKNKVSVYYLRIKALSEKLTPEELVKVLRHLALHRYNNKFIVDDKKGKKYKATKEKFRELIDCVKKHVKQREQKEFKCNLNSNHVTLCHLIILKKLQERKFIIKEEEISKASPKKSCDPINLLSNLAKDTESKAYKELLELRELNDFLEELKNSKESLTDDAGKLLKIQEHLNYDNVLYRENIKEETERILKAQCDYYGVTEEKKRKISDLITEQLAMSVKYPGFCSIYCGHDKPEYKCPDFLYKYELFKLYEDLANIRFDIIVSKQVANVIADNGGRPPKQATKKEEKEWEKEIKQENLGLTKKEIEELIVKKIGENCHSIREIKKLITEIRRDELAQNEEIYIDTDKWKDKNFGFGFYKKMYEFITSPPISDDAENQGGLGGDISNLDNDGKHRLTCVIYAIRLFLSYKEKATDEIRKLYKQALGDSGRESDLFNKEENTFNRETMVRKCLELCKVEVSVEKEKRLRAWIAENVKTKYGSFSVKAVGQILDEMQKGKPNDESGLNSSETEIVRKNNWEEKFGKSEDELPYYGKILRQFVYCPGAVKNLSADDEKLSYKELEEKYGTIPNPRVHQVLNCIRRLVNNLSAQKIKIDKITIETSREIGVGEKHRKKEEKINKENRIYNEKIKKNYKLTQDRGREFDRAKLHDVHGGIFTYPTKCFIKQVDKEQIQSLEISHIVPLAEGGMKNLKNCYLLTGYDNRKQGGEIANISYVIACLRRRLEEILKLKGKNKKEEAEKKDDKNTEEEKNSDADKIKNAQLRFLRKQIKYLISVSSELKNNKFVDRNNQNVEGDSHFANRAVKQYLKCLRLSDKRQVESSDNSTENEDGKYQTVFPAHGKITAALRQTLFNYDHEKHEVTDFPLFNKNVDNSKFWECEVDRIIKRKDRNYLFHHFIDAICLRFIDHGLSQYYVNVTGYLNSIESEMREILPLRPKESNNNESPPGEEELLANLRKKADETIEKRLEGEYISDSKNNKTKKPDKSYIDAMREIKDKFLNEIKIQESKGGLLWNLRDFNRVRERALIAALYYKILNGYFNGDRNELCKWKNNIREEIQNTITDRDRLCIAVYNRKCVKFTERARKKNIAGDMLHEETYYSSCLKLTADNGKIAIIKIPQKAWVTVMRDKFQNNAQIRRDFISKRTEFAKNVYDKMCRLRYCKPGITKYELMLLKNEEIFKVFFEKSKKKKPDLYLPLLAGKFLDEEEAENKQNVLIAGIGKKFKELPADKRCKEWIKKQSAKGKNTESDTNTEDKENAKDSKKITKETCPLYLQYIFSVNNEHTKELRKLLGKFRITSHHTIAIPICEASTTFTPIGIRKNGKGEIDIKHMVFVKTGNNAYADISTGKVVANIDYYDKNAELNKGIKLLIGDILELSEPAGEGSNRIRNVLAICKLFRIFKMSVNSVNLVPHFLDREYNKKSLGDLKKKIGDLEKKSKNGELDKILQDIEEKIKWYEEQLENTKEFQRKWYVKADIKKNEDIESGFSLSINKLGKYKAKLVIHDIDGKTKKILLTPTAFEQ